MAAKKDFSEMKTGKVREALEMATNGSRQTDASPEEQAIRAAEMRTQGRQGCRLPRVNIALKPECYEFVRVMSKATGNTMNAFVNIVLTAYMNEHPEVMAQARSFLDTVNSGQFSALRKKSEGTGGGADQAEE